MPWIRRVGSMVGVAQHEPERSQHRQDQACTECTLLTCTHSLGPPKPYRSLKSQRQVPQTPVSSKTPAQFPPAAIHPAAPYHSKVSDK
jgi:hypothetical protein